MTIIIDAITYDVPVLSLVETCDFLDKFAERTEDGVLQRELIGSYHNYQIQFGAHAAASELAALWIKLTEATEYHTVTVPDESGIDYTFTAYFSSVRRTLRKDTAALTFWKELSAHFISQSPRRTPA